MSVNDVKKMALIGLGIIVYEMYVSKVVEQYV